jgi:hypothetical protein
MAAFAKSWRPPEARCLPRPLVCADKGTPTDPVLTQSLILFNYLLYVRLLAHICHFFLKCVRPLADITTDDEGVAIASFAFSTNLVGAVYGFDMYPEGAPAGNKFQSAQVSFQ